MIFRQASRDEILMLRALVLRSGKPIETAIFKEDGVDGCYHFGGFEGVDCRVCASIYPSEWMGKPAFQLRGMAVHPADQKLGYGTRLLEEILEFVRHRAPGSILWCNAREKAVPFYQKNEWEIAGDFFDIPEIGPHVKMWRTL